MRWISGTAYCAISLSVLAFLQLGCAQTGAVRGTTGSARVQSLSALVHSAIREAKTVPLGDRMRIGNYYPKDTFIEIPDHLDGSGNVIMNRFAALPQSATCKVQADSGEISFTVNREPTLTMTRIRVIPSAGIVVKDYRVYWKGQKAKLQGVWVFIDDDGGIAPLLSVEGD